MTRVEEHTVVGRTAMDAGGVLGVRDLVASFRTHSRVIDGVGFSLSRGEIFVLLGPSGCGKTTTLRCLAGLHEPDSGEIAIGGETVYSDRRRINRPPDKRSIGMVFQSYALWPHMTVAENIEFPLLSERENRGRSRRQSVRARVIEALDVVGLASYEASYPWQLSGGQQQRIALARALVARPALLLMDEPLSNLDAQLRVELRKWIRKTLNEQQMTCVYVTHDHEEALSLADEIAVMASGRIIERAAPDVLYHQPRTRLGALAVGRANLLRAKVAEVRGPAEAVVDTAWGRVPAATTRQASVGSEVSLLIRPVNGRLIRPGADAGSGALLRGRLTGKTFLGEAVEYEVENAGEAMTLRASRDSDAYHVGDDVEISLTGACIVAEDAGDHEESPERAAH